jgi:hypothetical protein
MVLDEGRDEMSEDPVAITHSEVVLPAFLIDVG